MRAENKSSRVRLHEFVERAAWPNTGHSQRPTPKACLIMLHSHCRRCHEISGSLLLLAEMSSCLRPSPTSWLRPSLTLPSTHVASSCLAHTAFLPMLRIPSSIDRMLVDRGNVGHSRYKSVASPEGELATIARGPPSIN